MFRAWDDAVRVLTGKPTGSKVTGEVFDILESDGIERSVQHIYPSTYSYGRPAFGSIVRDDDQQNMRRPKAKLQ